MPDPLKQILKGIRKDSRIPVLAISMSVALLWYLVIASKHTSDHFYFTWRNLAYVLFAFFLISGLNHNESDTAPSKQAIPIKRIIALCLCFAFAFATYCIVPAEKLHVHNYLEDNPIEQTLPAQTKDACSYSFIPSYNLVMKIEPLLSCDDPNGYYEISVSDNERILYTETISSNNPESNVNPAEVFWLLKKGKEYQINISTEHVNAPVTMFFTDELTMSEYSANDLYPMMGIFYRVKFQRKTVSAYYILSWFAYYLVYLHLFCMIPKKK